MSSRNGSQSDPIALYSSTDVEIRFQYLKRPSDDPVKQEELREQLNAIGGVNLRSDMVRSSIPIATFSSDDEKLRCFLDVMDWCISELRFVLPESHCSGRDIVALPYLVH